MKDIQYVYINIISSILNDTAQFSSDHLYSLLIGITTTIPLPIFGATSQKITRFQFHYGKNLLHYSIFN